MKTKLVPFDIEKAKNGAKVVTRRGYPVRMGFYDLKGEPFTIAGAVKEEATNTEFVRTFTKEGKHYSTGIDDDYDLFIEEEEVEEKHNSKNDGKRLRRSDSADNGCKSAFKCVDWSEQQRDQESINKIKLKFKVGDYIVNDFVNMEGRIVKITDHSYQFGTGQGIPFEDNMTRLWDITKDAKPGDVLAVNNNVFIYAHRKQTDPLAFAHCFVNRAGGFYLDGEFGYQEYTEISPATKEQRDLLFRKMKEAGYMWNPIKKELKKIENKAVAKIEPELKLGDFLVSDDCCFGKVVEITDNSYKLETGYGDFYWKFSSNFEIHPWTVQDAKPGDVLASKDPEMGDDILIFKEIDGWISFSSYYNIRQKRNEDWLTDCFQPATKKQCELLFRKMKEAGYKWDKKKKELKKIKVGNVKKGVKKRRMTNQ